MIRAGSIPALRILLLAVILGGCAQDHLLIAPASPLPPVETVELGDTPFFPQDDHQCGPAALASVLNASGVSVTPQELVGKIYLPKRKGSLQLELQAAARRYGRIPYVIDPFLDALLDELRAGHPVLVLQNLGFERVPIWHYAVVIGFDTQRDDLILRSGSQERVAMSARRFLRSWQRAGSWAFVVLRPDEFPARVQRDKYFKAVAALERQDNPQLLEKAFARAVVQWPQDALALLGLGNAYLAQHRLAEAEEVYRNLIRLYPDNVPALNNLAMTLAERGCYRSANEQIAHAMEAQNSAFADTLKQTQQEIKQLAERAPAENALCVSDAN